MSTAVVRNPAAPASTSTSYGFTAWRGPLSMRYGCMNRRFCSSFSVKTVSCMLSASMIVFFTSGMNSVRARVASACPSSPNPRLL